MASQEESRRAVALVVLLRVCFSLAERAELASWNCTTPGHASHLVTGECVACPPGSHDALGREEGLLRPPWNCHNCPSGTFSSKRGATECAGRCSEVGDNVYPTFSSYGATTAEEACSHICKTGSFLDAVEPVRMDFFRNDGQTPSPSVGALDAPRSLVMSPDGRHLYVAASFSDAVSTFLWDPESAPNILRYVTSMRFGDAFRATDGEVIGLDQPMDLIVSPDGRHVYAVSRTTHSVASFRRDAASGILAYDRRFPSRSKLGQKMSMPVSLDISPDGRHIYVAAYNSSSLSIIERDADSGGLSFVRSVTGLECLGGAHSVSVARDGRNVYVVGKGSNGICTFSLNSTTGDVRAVQDIVGVVVDGIEVLTEAYTVRVAPDCKNVYVASKKKHTVTTWNRDEADGSLTLVQTIRQGTDAEVGDTKRAPYMISTRALAVSKNGRRVYVATSNGRAMVYFDRAADGLLTYAGAIKNGDVVDEDEVVTGLDGAHAATLSPSGEALFVAGSKDDSVVVFSIDAETDDVQYVHTVTEGDPLTGNFLQSKGLRNTYDVFAGSTRHVYTASRNSNSVTVFLRHVDTNVLSQFAIFTEADLPPTKRGGLLGATSLSLSSDSKYAYVAAHEGHALSIFKQEPGTGLLNFVGVVADRALSPVKDADLAVDHLQKPTSVVTTPDCRHVYVVASNSTAILAFSQEDSAYGMLQHVDTKVLRACLNGTAAVRVSPDGRHVYVASKSGSVSAFARNVSSGELDLIQCTMNTSTLAGAEGLSVSPDGHHVYVVASVSNSTSVFLRDTESGKLLLVQTLKEGDVISADGSRLDGLETATSVVVDPTGTYVYVTGWSDHRLNVFLRNAISGELSLAGSIRHGENFRSTVATGLLTPRAVGVSPDAEQVYVTTGMGIVTIQLSCRLCDAGHACSGYTAPQACPPGKHQRLTGQSECDGCPGGYFQEQPAQVFCDVCGLGFWAAEEASSCTACPNGRYSDELFVTSPEQCKACSPGRVATLDVDGNFQTSCDVCEAGRYSNADLSHCDICDNGRFSSLSGLSAPEDCMPCPIGRAAKANPPTLRTSEAQTCTDCLPGYYRGLHDALDSCLPCPPDTYAPRANSSTCLPCSQCTSGSRAKKMCSATQNRECEHCPAGTYQPQGNAPECIGCPEGSYCPPSASEKLPCGAASLFCPVGSSLPQAVQLGYYSTPENAPQNMRTGEESCPSGFYCSGGLRFECRESDLVTCPPGSAEPLILEPQEVLSGSTVSGTLDVGVADDGNAIPYEAIQGALAQALSVPAEWLNITQAPVRRMLMEDDLKFSFTVVGDMDEMYRVWTLLVDHDAFVEGETARFLADDYSVDEVGVSVSQESSDGPEYHFEEADAGEYISGDRTTVATCSAGYYCPGGASPALQCPVGSFADQQGSSECVLCERNSYQSAEGQEDCNKCPLYSVAESGSSTIYACICLFGSQSHSENHESFTCGCPRGQYLDNNELLEVIDKVEDPTTEHLLRFTDVCKECRLGYDCTEEGQTLYELSVKEGYYRTYEWSPEVLPCYQEHACVGGNGTGDALCKEGHEGPYCTVCSDGYFADFDRCVECDSDDAILPIVTTFTLVLLVLIVLVACFRRMAHRERQRRVTKEQEDTENPAVKLDPSGSGGDEDGGDDDLDAGADADADADAEDGYGNANGDLPVETKEQPVQRKSSRKKRQPKLQSIMMWREALHQYNDQQDRYMRFWEGLQSLLDVSENQRGLELAYDAWIAGWNMTGKFVDKWVSLKTKLRICFSFLQLQTLAVTGFDLPSPLHFRELMYVFNWVSFDLVSGFFADCVFHANFFDGLVAMTAGPLILLSLGGIVMALLPRKSARRQNLAYMMLLLTFVVLPSATTVTCNTFLCERFDTSREGEDDEFLVEDYSIKCHTHEHNLYKIYAGFMLLIYPFGVPAVYLTLLLWRPSKLDLSVPQVFMRLREVRSTLLRRLEERRRESMIGGMAVSREVALRKLDDKIGASTRRALEHVDDNPDCVDTLLAYCTAENLRNTFEWLQEKDFDRRELKVKKLLDAPQWCSARINAIQENRGWWKSLAQQSNNEKNFWPETAQRMVRHVSNARFLVESARASFFFLEIVEALRRLALAALPIVFERGSISQMACGMVATVFFLAWYANALPYVNKSDNRISLTSQMTLFLLFLYGMMLECQSSSLGDQDLSFGLVLLSINLVILLTAVLIVLVMWTEIQDEVFQVFSSIGSSCFGILLKLWSPCRKCKDDNRRSVESIPPPSPVSDANTEISDSGDEREYFT